MSQFYKILKADPLGDPWTPNAPDAKPIQNFWCQVEGEEWPVSIGKQVPNTLTAGENVYGDLMKARSQKGTDYWKFKSQKVPDDVPRPASTPAQATAQQATGAAGFADQWAANTGEVMPKWFVPSYNMLLSLKKDMELLKGDEDAPAIFPDTPKEEPVLAEPVDQQTQATLDGIFGKTTPATTEPEPEV